MREALFIKKNADKWTEYQHSPTENPDEMADRFVTLIDDLSYAKTFYPKSKVTRWINGIAAGIYQSIYQNKKEKYSRIIKFWKYELPLLLKRHHRTFLFAFTLFVIFVLVGIFSSMHNQDFVRGVLGDGYVDMTEDNINKGDPFGVYRSDSPFTMFITIAFNNIKVALFAFMAGFTLGILTTWLMWSNGIMLGCFEYMFFSKGLGLKSVMVIWVHGTLEISAIVIASTAGYIIANGILFPGTYRRMDSFRRNFKDAVKIMLTLIPIFIVAAFFESFVTHLMSNSYSDGQDSGMPAWVSALILILSLYFIIWYFIIYPIRLHKRGFYLQPDGIINRLKKTNA
ncbi:MAG: stage II sporulation protein M [Ferruginibacter sp.]